MPKLKANVPKQERSRHTLFRLLSAAEALLEHGGLDAATVPAIAEAAGVSVGVIYRRFPNKDALLRVVYERFFTTTAEQNVLRLQAVNAGGAKIPLARLARGIVKGLVEGYRRRRGLLRALTHYARTHPDPSFRRSARKVNRTTMSALIYVLGAYRDEIRHPNPEAAIEFAILTIASVLHTVLIEDERLALRVPENLEEELVRMLFGYLGIDEAGPRKSRTQNANAE